MTGRRDGRAGSSPNQPVYFLIFYRANTQYAFMVIAASPAIRTALTVALAEAI